MMKTNTNTNRPNRNQLEPIHSTSLLTASAAVFLKTSKQFLTVAVGAGVVLAMVGLPGASVQAGVADPWGILNFTTNPYRTGTTAWAVGDKIRYAFVTKGTHNAVSKDIEVYNTWANEQANAVGSKVKDKSTAWKVAAGTAEYTDAPEYNGPEYAGVIGIDNTDMRLDDGIPVFRLDANTTRMSDSSRGWWFDGLLAACNVDQDGTTRSGQAYNGAACWGPEAPNSDVNTQGNYGALGDSGPRLVASTGNFGLTDGDRWSNSGSPLTTLNRFRVVSAVITLVSDASDPYATWAGPSPGYNLTGPDAAKDADPDKDGQNNLMEFATNGDPTSGASGPRCYPLMYVIGADNALTYTMAVRTGATFAAAGSKQTATKDGVVYLVEGTKDLTTWNVVTVTEVTGTDATAVKTALGAKLTSPALGSDWEWHTFRTAGGTPTNTNDFVRLKVDVAP